MPSHKKKPPHPIQRPQSTYPTPRQFDVLMAFYRHHKMLAHRTKRPSWSDVALEVGGISKLGALHHMQALQRKGYLEQRAIWEHRGWELTEKGLKRAEKRWKLIQKNEKKQREAEKALRFKQTKAGRAAERRAFKEKVRKRLTTPDAS